MKFKVNNREVDYEFKHMTLPADHGFDDNALALLMKIDQALVNAKEGDKFQAQINDLYVRLEEKGMRPYVSGKSNPKQRELTEKWIRNTFRRKDNSAIEAELKSMETKEFTNYLDTGTDGSGGGFLVPELIQAEIAHLTEQGGIARKYFRYLPFGNSAGNTKKLPKESNSVTVGWVDEGSAKSVSNISIDTVTLSLKVLAVITIMTEEIIEDANLDLVQYLSQRVADAINAEIDNQFFSGNGSPFTGIINTANIDHYALAPGVGPVSMRPEALLALIAGMPKGALNGACFFMHHSVYSAILARRADAVAEGDTKGQYLVQQPGQGSPANLWGFPVIECEALPSLTDLGYTAEDGEFAGDCDPDTPFLVFGNLAKCCTYADKMGIRVKLLDQATITSGEDSINLAQNDMAALRIHQRVTYCTQLPEGIKVLDTGPTS